MIAKTITVDVPFTPVAADNTYGVDEIEMALRRARKGYVPGVNSNHRFNSWSTALSVAGEAEDITAFLPANAW